MPNTKNTENLAKASISSTINNDDNAILSTGMRSLGAKIAMYRRWTENEFSARSTNNLWICQSNLSRFHVAKILWTKLHTIQYIMLKMIVWHQFPALTGYILHDTLIIWIYFPPKTTSSHSPWTISQILYKKPISKCLCS